MIKKGVEYKGQKPNEITVRDFAIDIGINITIILIRKHRVLHGIKI